MGSEGPNQPASGGLPQWLVVWWDGVNSRERNWLVTAPSAEDALTICRTHMRRRREDFDMPVVKAVERIDAVEQVP